MLNPYASYQMTLLELRHIDNRLEATVEASPEVWEYVDLLMFFNLRWDVRNEGSISGTKTVQIKMVLDKNIYQSLVSSGQLLTDKNAFIESPSEHPMRGTSNWFALEVTEETDLPDSLKELGSLREGFSTKWKDDY
jgi:hypothetical protein